MKKKHKYNYLIKKYQLVNVRIPYGFEKFKDKKVYDLLRKSSQERKLSVLKLNKRENKEFNNNLIFLYEETLQVHYEKYKNIENNSPLKKSRKEELNNHISKIVDLLFSFNSYLVQYCIFQGFITAKAGFFHKSVRKKKQETNLDNDNFNSSIAEVLKLICDKGVKVNSHYIHLLNIYEKLFRHSVAHGKVSNLVNILLYEKVFFVLVKNQMQSQLRILLDEKEFYKNINLLSSTSKNDSLKDSEILSSIFDPLKPWKKSSWFMPTSQNGEKMYLLDEEASISYINIKSFKYYFKNNSSHDFYIDSHMGNNQTFKNLVHLTIIEKEADTVPNFSSHYLNYDVVKDYIENIINQIKFKRNYQVSPFMKKFLEINCNRQINDDLFNNLINNLTVLNKFKLIKKINKKISPKN